MNSQLYNISSSSSTTTTTTVLVLLGIWITKLAGVFGNPVYDLG